MLNLPRAYVDEIIAHAREDDPNECCGILAGIGSDAHHLYRMTNVEHSPFRYSMDPKELYQTTREMEDHGWEIMAIYHSHTHSQAYPSATDIRLATWPDGASIWPGAYYILVSLEDKANPVVRAFRIEDGIVTEEDLRTTADAP